jgi:ribosomal protection tetracycline resistance protein
MLGIVAAYLVTQGQLSIANGLRPFLVSLLAILASFLVDGASSTLEGEVPAARVHELRQQLSALTRGEGVLESAFAHYQPVVGTIPTRPRTDHNPLNRKEYLLRVTRGGRAGRRV